MIAEAYDEVLLSIEKKAFWREKLFDHIKPEVLSNFGAWKTDKFKALEVTHNFKSTHGRNVGNQSSMLKKACWGSKIHEAYTEAKNEINTRYNMWYRSWNTKPPLRKLSQHIV